MALGQDERAILLPSRGRTVFGSCTIRPSTLLGLSYIFIIGAFGHESSKTGRLLTGFKGCLSEVEIFSLAFVFVLKGS